MLKALHDFAKREGLLRDPDYEPVKVHFELRIDPQGGVRELIPMVDEQGRPRSLLVPRLGTRTAKVVPRFLVDNAKYVLGYEPDEAATPKKSAKKSNPERLRERAEAFARCVREANSTFCDEGLTAVLQFTQRLDENRAIVLQRWPESIKRTGSETFVFRLDGDPHYVHERPKAREAWSAARASSAQSSAGLQRCLVSGQLARPAETHPVIKRIPGAQSSGATLVSFNSEAFTSMGFTQSLNAPVSRAAAEGYTRGLNFMLEEGTGGRRFRQGIAVSPDTVVVVWTRDAAPEIVSLLDLIDAPASETALKVLEAPSSGLSPSDVDVSPFYAVTLGGNAARVVVRDWFETTLGEVKARVRDWFKALELVHAPPGPLPLWKLIQAIDPTGQANVPPAIVAAISRAALFGGRVPPEVLRHSLVRLRVPEKYDQTHPRVALIKATLIRTFRKEVFVSLDESSTHVPYLLGRLFAVIERLQGVALGDLNATIRDRYFGAASTSPSVVFPRLLKLSVHHAAKADLKGRWLEKIKGQVIAALPAQRFPSVLALEDQGLFAVGYYHQREDFFIRKSDVPEKPDLSSHPITGERHG